MEISHLLQPGNTSNHIIVFFIFRERIAVTGIIKDQGFSLFKLREVLLRLPASLFIIIFLSCPGLIQDIIAVHGFIAPGTRCRWRQCKQRRVRISLSPPAWRINLNLNGIFAKSIHAASARSLTGMRRACLSGMFRLIVQIPVFCNQCSGIRILPYTICIAARALTDMTVPPIAMPCKAQAHMHCHATISSEKCIIKSKSENPF